MKDRKAQTGFKVFQVPVLLWRKREKLIKLLKVSMGITTLQVTNKKKKKKEINMQFLNQERMGKKYTQENRR